jgi:thioredoxin 1
MMASGYIVGAAVIACCLVAFVVVKERSVGRSEGAEKEEGKVMNGVKQVQEAAFRAEVMDSDVPVLVDFYAPWCGPCRMLAPMLEEVAREYDGRVKVVKVNVDEAQQLAADFGIRGVPTLMLFKHGDVTETLVGLPSPKALRAKLDALVAACRRIGVVGCSA